MEIVWGVVGGILGIALGLAVGYVLWRNATQGKIKVQQAEAQRLLADAEKEAKETVLAAKSEALRARDAAEGELERLRTGLRREEERLQQRREKVDYRQEQLEVREQALTKRQSALDKQRSEVEKLHQEQSVALQRIANLTQEQAKQELLDSVALNARQDMARVIRQVEAEAKEEGDARARKVITTAVQRMASEQVAEMTVTTVPLPSDEMKGRIIGRNGRNIRAFETSHRRRCGRRRHARRRSRSPASTRCAARSPNARWSKLVPDGRIHPGRIEKLVDDCRKEVEQIIREEGERAAYEAGVHGPAPRDHQAAGPAASSAPVTGRTSTRTPSRRRKLSGHARRRAGRDVATLRKHGWPAARHRQGDRPRGRGHARRHRQRDPAALRRLRRDRATASRATTTRPSRKRSRPSSSRRPMPSQARGPAHGAKAWSRTSSASVTSRTSPIRSPASQSLRYSGRPRGAHHRPAGRDRRSGDIAACKGHRAALEESMKYPGQIKVTVIREVRAEEFAK